MLFFTFLLCLLSILAVFSCKKGPLMSTQNAARDIHHGRHLLRFLPDSSLTRRVQAKNFIV